MIAARVLAAALLLAWGAAAGAAQEDDRHVGYYYPPLSSEEDYTARAQTLPGSDRDRSIGFIVAFNKELAGDPYP